MTNPLRQCWLTSALVISCQLIGLVAGQAQDAEDDEPVVAEIGHFEVDPSNFDQWIFGNTQNGQDGKKRIDELLKLHVEDVDRACRITDKQRLKLALAGRGDVKRFFEDVERVRVKFMAVRKDQQKFNEIWQDIQPLQTRLQSGLFDEDSFFFKTIAATLEEAQLTAYERVLLARRHARYQALVELWMTMLESSMPMHGDQRKKFLAYMLEKTTPPQRFGQYGAYLVMYHASKLPEDELKKIFDEAQWPVFQQQLQQGRGMEVFLREQKLLPKADEPPTEIRIPGIEGR